MTYTYSGTTHRLTSATSPLGIPETGTFTYDNVGIMLGDGTGTYNVHCAQPDGHGHGRGAGDQLHL